MEVLTNNYAWVGVFRTLKLVLANVDLFLDLVIWIKVDIFNLFEQGSCLECNGSASTIKIEALRMFLKLIKFTI